VTVKVRGGEGLTGAQVMAIVDMVRGAVPGLKREDVHVTDGQRVYHAPSGDTPMPSDLLAYKKAMEEEYTRKLWNMFGYVGNVKIAVNVVPDMASRVKTTETYEKNPVKAVQSETNRETTSNEGAGGNGGEPGLKPNTAVSTGDTGNSGRHTSSTMTDTTSKYENKFPGSVEKAVLPPGTEIREMTASISFPRSYFVQLYQRINKDPDPKDELLQPVIDAQMKRAVATAQGAIGEKAQIRTDWFDDTIMPRGVEIAGMGGSLASGGSMSALVSQYAKQAVLGAVALGVLGMMLMMVRRAVPSTGGAEIDPSVFFGGAGGGGGGGGRAAVAGGKRRKGEPGMMDVGEDIFGEAGEGDAVLTGIELDDETRASRKMVDEVSTMIKDNPENAAALVKRWIQKGK
jgi:flagellar biosynthesis/type III secretory pathway M-ring protein FliF/YscJ